MKRIVTLIFLLLPLAGFAQQLSLQDCLDAAAQGNVSVKKSSLDVLAARALRDEARWEYAPKVSVTALAYDALNPMLRITLRDVLGNSDAAGALTESLTASAYENGIKPYYESLSKGYGATATLLQPLYTGGRIATGNRLADLGVEASGLQERLARKAAADSVESKYWRIVALQEKQKTVKEAMEMLESLEKDVASAISAGLLTELDRTQLHLKKSELEAGSHRLNGSIALLKMELLDFIGYPYEYTTIGQITLSGSLDNLPTPEEVMADSPSVEDTDEARLLQIQIDAKEGERKMAVGELLPQVAVGASYGYNAMMLPKDGSFNGLVFAMVQVPITDLGKASARSKRYGYAVQQAQMDRDYLMSQLRLRDAMCRLQVETLWLEIASARDAAEYAEDALRKAEVRLRAGQAPASEVLQASLTATSARETLLQKKVAYRVATTYFRYTLR